MDDEAKRLEITDAPLWHEGMLLAPQHLQQFSAHVDQRERARSRLADKFAYGVVEIEVDNSALVSGLFRLSKLTAVMPDGLIVRIPQRDGATFEIDLTAYTDRLRSRPLQIDLTIPRENAGDGQVNRERYRQVPGNEELDASGGGGRVQVPREIPTLGLRVADRPTQKFVTLPLAGVVLQDEAYTLTPYVPPRLVLSNDLGFTRELTALTRRVREKAVYLSERARSHRARSADDAAEELRVPFMGLAQALPDLEALLASGNGHPFSVYRAICRTAGAMTGVANFAIPPQGRGYTHEDIRASYRPMVDFISGCLDQIRQDFTVVAFDAIHDGFSLDLKTQRSQERLVVAAQVAPGASPDATWSWLEESLIAAEGHLDDLRRRRVLGAARRVLTRDEAIGYSLASDTVLAAVELDGTNVGTDDTIAIINTSPERSEARPVQLYAYVPFDETGAT